MSCKELAMAWGIAPTKTSQAWEPFRAKLVGLIVFYSARNRLSEFQRMIADLIAEAESKTLPRLDPQVRI